MRALLLRCYPARWRARYGDEFAAVLEERPLGPFDVADVLLGALDAHLHLRGLGAASEHRKGFAMPLRIGGYAAIASGLLWLIVMAANAVNDGDEAGLPWIGPVLLALVVTNLVALTGLSAFQARRYPVLTWAAFAVPALGAVTALLAGAGMAISGNSDAVLVGELSGWAIATLGFAALVIGSGLFGLATWLARSLSRTASGLLVVGSLSVVIGLAGVLGGSAPEALAPVLTLAVVVIFPAGWVAMGVSALRVARPNFAPLEGASL
jgi:hypothetical protein